MFFLTYKIIADIMHGTYYNREIKIIKKKNNGSFVGDRVKL
jgi:hypothetical protein